MTVEFVSGKALAAGAAGAMFKQWDRWLAPLPLTLCYAAATYPTHENLGIRENIPS